MRALAETYGFKPVVVDPVTPFPLMEVDSWLTGRRAIALPFTDECAPLCASAGQAQALLQRTCELGRHRGWKYLELRGGFPGCTATESSVQFYAHQTDLRAPESDLRKTIEPSVARAVRKAERSGLSATVSTGWEDVVTFYHLLCATRRRHGVPPQPMALFTHLHRYLLTRGLGFVVLAKQGTRAVAGALFLRWGTRAAYKYGATDLRFQELRGSNLAMWTGMLALKQAGAEVLDFGRTSLSNEGLRRFKLGWGATERLLPYFRFDLRSGAIAPMSDRSTGWHNRLFRRMPLPLSSLIAKFIYPHVA